MVVGPTFRPFASTKMANETVTMSMVQNLLEIQAKNFRTALELMVGTLKEDIKELRKDVSDLKTSLNFSQAKQDQIDLKVKTLDDKIKVNERSIQDSFGYIEDLDSNVEYIENQSRRNNLKILGVPEDKEKEQTWDQTEEVVKSLIQNELGSSEDFKFERCHRVGNPNRSNKQQRNDGRNRSNEPRPIVAKFLRYLLLFLKS